MRAKIEVTRSGQTPTGPRRRIGALCALQVPNKLEGLLAESREIRCQRRSGVCPSRQQMPPMAQLAAMPWPPARMPEKPCFSARAQGEQHIRPDGASVKVKQLCRPLPLCPPSCLLRAELLHQCARPMLVWHTGQYCKCWVLPQTSGREEHSLQRQQRQLRRQATRTNKGRQNKRGNRAEIRATQSKETHMEGSKGTAPGGWLLLSS